MNDKEFISLLNLYVDREISADDALRLEKVVATNPRRREIYDQYCRIQKACSMLSEETLDMSSVRTTATVLAFPTQSPWRFGPVVAGLAAAAACAVAIVGVRNGPTSSAATLAADASRSVAVGSAANLSADSVSMKPVLFVRLPSDQDPRGTQPTLLADADAQSAMPQLNWIGDIHMSPVAPSAMGDFLLNPKADLKAAVMTDTQTGHDAQEPVEMTAFRFQR
jgi:anti-sigma factor RsiW